MEKYLKLSAGIVVGFILQAMFGYFSILLITLVVMGYLMIKLRQYKKVLGA